MKEFLDSDFATAGEMNIIKRARQLTELKWIPIRDTINAYIKKGDVINFYNYEKGKEYEGIPYSSVVRSANYITAKYSPETFISMLANPNAKIYTCDLRDVYGVPRECAYCGMVCSRFAAHCFGIDKLYNTARFLEIDGMELIKDIGCYDENDIKICDVMLAPKFHVSVVTDIIRDENKKVIAFEISEETSNPRMRRIRFGLKEFFEYFAKYQLVRYKYKELVEYHPDNLVNIFDEKDELDDRIYDVLTRYGDKCNINEREEKEIYLDIITPGWQKLRLYKDEKLISENDISGKDHFLFEDLAPGYYKALLINENKESRPCFFCIVKSSVSASFIEDGKVDISYEYSGGDPCWVQLGGQGESYFLDIKDPHGETVLYNEKRIEKKCIRVAVKNEYGIYLTEYIDF